jgi:hypothetical protein
VHRRLFEGAAADTAMGKWRDIHDSFTVVRTMSSPADNHRAMALPRNWLADGIGSAYRLLPRVSRSAKVVAKHMCSVAIVSTPQARPM